MGISKLEDMACLVFDVLGSCSSGVDHVGLCNSSIIKRGRGKTTCVAVNAGGWSFLEVPETCAQ